MSKQSFTTGQVLTASQVNSLQANDYNQTVSVKTASYVLVAADKGTRIEFNTSGSVTCTVNSGLFDAGDTLVIQNRGAGVVTVTAGTATVNTSATLALSQYDAGTLYFVSDSASIFFNTDAGGGSPLTTKGDLFSFSTVDARLAVGNNGETLVADSSATTGLRYQTGVNTNSVINGGMDLWQRGTSVVGNSTNFASDRFRAFRGTTGSTFSRQASGLTGIQYALRLQRDSGNTATNGISTWYTAESADTYRLAGQTVTLSFYARAGANFSAASSQINVILQTGTGTDQAYGSFTGSSNIVSTTQAITTSWVRYSFTASVASTATQFAIEVYYNPVGTAGAADYFDITGVQLEVGSVATNFKRAGGTLAGELAACQRYYYVHASGSGKSIGMSSVYNTGEINTIHSFPVTMRTTPTLTSSSGTGHFKLYGNGTTYTFAGPWTTFQTSTTMGGMYFLGSGLGQGTAGILYGDNASSSVAWSAEL